MPITRIKNWKQGCVSFQSFYITQKDLVLHWRILVACSCKWRMYVIFWKRVHLILELCEHMKGREWIKSKDRRCIRQCKNRETTEKRNIKVPGKYYPKIWRRPKRQGRNHQSTQNLSQKIWRHHKKIVEPELQYTNILHR